jgi:hypothetical protein
MTILEDFEKKDRNIVIIAVVALIVIASTGIILWQVNKAEDLSSEDSEAASNMACGEYGCTKDSDCAGWNGGSGDYECDEVVGNNPAEQRCVRYRCPDGYKVEKPGKCKCVAIEENTCEGGAWTRKPRNFTVDESYTVSGYGEDADGISFTSIDVKVDNVSIASYKVNKQVDGNRIDWSTTLSDLDVGEHTIEVYWEDGNGKSSDECTLTETFYVTGVQEEPEEEPEEEEEETNVIVIEQPSTPQTGLLDEAWGKVVLGFGILVTGMIFRKVNLFEFGWNGVSIIGEESRKRAKNDRMSTDFERRVVKDN